MDTEIANLETKLSQLVDQFQRARTDNRDLRARVAVLEQENTVLASKVRAAVDRVESVLARLPTGVEE